LSWYSNIKITSWNSEGWNNWEWGDSEWKQLRMNCEKCLNSECIQAGTVKGETIENEEIASGGNCEWIVKSVWIVNLCMPLNNESQGRCK